MPEPAHVHRARRSVVCAIAAVAASAFLHPSSGLAQEIPGFVSRVLTGDRLEFRTADRRMTVQLADVVAPASGHPLAAPAREALAELCLSQAATLRETGTATDGAVLGHVTCAGKSAAEQQVRRGLAEVRAPILARDTLMQEALREAKAKGVGMWAR